MTKKTCTVSCGPTVKVNLVLSAIYKYTLRPYGMAPHGIKDTEHAYINKTINANSKLAVTMCNLGQDTFVTCGTRLKNALCTKE